MSGRDNSVTDKLLEVDLKMLFLIQYRRDLLSSRNITSVDLLDEDNFGSIEDFLRRHHAYLSGLPASTTPAPVSLLAPPSAGDELRGHSRSPSPTSNTILPPLSPRRAFNPLVAQTERVPGYHAEAFHENALKFTQDADWKSVLVDERFFFHFFEGSRFRAFFCVAEAEDKELGLATPAIVLVRPEGDTILRVLMFTVERSRYRVLSASAAEVAQIMAAEELPKLIRETDSIFENLLLQTALDSFDALSDRLKQYEGVTVQTRFKWGVLYKKPRQNTEEAIFANTMKEVNDPFRRFLKWLGDEVDLLYFPGYAGGLDTREGQSGLTTVTTAWKGYEICYHVGPLLTDEPDDPQRIAKKKHIGNDVVCFVFLEDPNDSFDPRCIASRFLDIWVEVRALAPHDLHFSVMHRDGISPFGPKLPAPPQFSADDTLGRDFILTKLLNGEYSAFRGPSFVKSMRRTRKGLLDELLLTFVEVDSTQAQAAAALAGSTSVGKGEGKKLRPTSMFPFKKGGKSKEK